MEREEWIARCAAQYAGRSGMSPGEAYVAAVTCWEQRDEGDGPEDSADEDMVCWLDDA